MGTSCWRRAFNLVGALLCFLIFSFPLLLLMLLGCIFGLFRPLVGMYLNRKYGEKIVFLNGLDAMCAIDSEVEPMNVTAILKLKGQANLTRLQKIIYMMVEAQDNEGRILYPTLSQYLHEDWGYYFWLTERQFNIEDHVLLYDGPLPRNEIEFNSICATVCKRRSPFGKSPWQFIVVPLPQNFHGNNNEPHYRIILSILHAMADGVSLVRLLSNHLFDQPYDETSPGSQKKNLNCVMAFLHIIVTLFYLPQALFRQLVIADKNSLHGKSVSGVKFVGFSTPTPLERVQRIRLSSSTTINDILMSCVAGALRSFFGGDSVSTATAIVPIANHQDTKPPQLKNSCSFVPLPLPIDIDNPKKRLMVAKRRMANIKISPNYYFNFYGFQFLTNRLPKSITRVYLNTLRITCIVSNVRGCKTCNTINGDTIEGAGFILPNRGKIGVGISLLTYNNYLQVGLIIDENLVKGPEDINTILSNFEKEMQILEKETSHL